MKKLNNKKGFTLMEMLIVVAIIAILIAIAIPTFTKQLEKSREATDGANIRAAYTSVISAGLLGETTGLSDGVTYKDGVYTKTVAPQQKVKKWNGAETVNIAGMDVKASTLKGWTITYNETTATGAISENAAS